MSVISGLVASVTFASGYTTSGHWWEINQTAESIENTAFTPTGNVGIITTGLITWRGSYGCRQHCVATTTLSGPAYITDAYRFRIRLEAEELPATLFTATYASWVSGLGRVSGTIDAWGDTTTVVPLVGSTATGVFTIDTGKSYSVPLVFTDIRARLSVDGASRDVSMDFKNTASYTPTGTIPDIGATGAATFLLHTGRSYSGTILVTSVEITCDRNRSEGEWNIGFVGQGTLAPA